ncbi:MAG TPA: mobile mystery protein A [Gemmatimonadaceae bacterium]
MSKSLKALKIRQLDETLSPFREIRRASAPQKGWIREIREALQMTAAQLGKRIGISQPAVSQLEESEADGTVTLNTLRKAARGLGGELIYAIVPHQTLNEMLNTQIHRIARERLDRTKHTMKLEDQAVPETESDRQFDELVAELIEKPPRNLWN